MSTRLNVAWKVFSQSVSGKLFNILTNKGRSLYIHDYAQNSAQVSVHVLTDLRMKATANILSLFLDRDRIRIE